ncbi:reverse transcriptase domain-containing protein [Tanacetum coccineum]|uniref:Reverse transcriptase domain-containing protein n=1 Tax=Tanacetum coccineum TaxID=301880 RepID=A0ABQ5FUN2_9ASTR
MDSGHVVPVFTQGDDPIACLNKAMAFLTAVASLRFPSTNNQLRTSSNLRNQATIQDGRVTVQQVQGRQGQSYAGTGYKGNATSSGGNNAGGQARVVKCYNCQGEGHMARQCTQPKRPRNAAWFKEKAMLAEAQESGQILDEEQLAFLADPGIPDGQAAQTTIPNTAAFQTEDLDAYDSDCDDVSNAKAVLMANLSNYGSDIISEVPHFEPYHTDMDNQSVHAMQGFEQTPVVDFTDNEITSDSNIISYSQYLQETQQAAVQDTNLYAQQDSMILSVIEQMSEQMINHVNNWEKANREKNNESLTAELERYIERVKTFKQHLNIDLSTRVKMIDSQMDDMIKENLALKQQLTHLNKIFLIKSKKRNLYCKHLQFSKMNPKKRKKAQRIKPTLYDGSVISSQHAASHVIDDEETLILEEVSRSKILAKQNDPMSKEKKVNTTPINYVELNRLSKDFGKRFVPQQELSDEQAFCLVNTSLKKFKYHLGQFDTVVKKKITPDAITEGEWGSEHTKAVFLKEIIPFLKTLKDIQTVFNQMEATVQQCSVHK